MILITLAKTPNQSFNFNDGENRFEISLKTIGDVMAADVRINDVDVIQGVMIVPGSPIIPYEHLEQGNFIFVTDDDEYPFYEQFGQSHRLLYVTPDELEALRNG